MKLTKEENQKRKAVEKEVQKFWLKYVIFQKLAGACYSFEDDDEERMYFCLFEAQLHIDELLEMQ